MFGVLLDSLRDSTISDYFLSMSPKNKILFFLPGGGSENNDHGFPFFGDVELVELSLRNNLGGLEIHETVFPAVSSI